MNAILLHLMHALDEERELSALWLIVVSISK